MSAAGPGNRPPWPYVTLRSALTCPCKARPILLGRKQKRSQTRPSYADGRTDHRAFHLPPGENLPCTACCLNINIALTFHPLCNELALFTLSHNRTHRVSEQCESAIDRESRETLPRTDVDHLHRRSSTEPNRHHPVTRCASWVANAQCSLQVDVLINNLLCLILSWARMVNKPCGHSYLASP